MSPAPQADIEITSDLVRAMLREQHPDLAELPLSHLAQGWDNVLFRLGEDFLVRIPRRTEAAAVIHYEQDWLPRLASRLSVTVPVPLRVGVPSAVFPWRWSVVSWLSGDRLCTAPVPARSSLVPVLAEFFVELHVPAPLDAPRNVVRGIPLSTCDARARRRMAKHPAHDQLRVLWEEAIRTPHWDGPPLWGHGDPHPANILVADATATPLTLRAVIDFGDINAGDPACDLSTAWLTLSSDQRQRFRAHYDQATGRDSATWIRARGWALHMALICLYEANDDPDLLEIGRFGIKQLLTEMSDFAV